MINHDYKFGKSQVTLMEFGNGTILTQTMIHEKGYSSVLFKSSVEHPIGKIHKTANQTPDQFKPEVAMVFTKIESVDVVLEKLKQAKLYMQNKLHTTPEEIQVEENADLISSFMEHVKEKTGHIIQDNVFESFFNA